MKFTYFPESHACLRMLHTRHPAGLPMPQMQRLLECLHPAAIWMQPVLLLDLL